MASTMMAIQSTETRQEVVIMQQKLHAQVRPSRMKLQRYEILAGA
jgi:hypothetical protein